MQELNDALNGSCQPGQSMSIHVRKITDSCRDKDCIEDLRVYLTRSSQQILDTASNVRVRSAQLLTTYIDVESVAFDKNHYCIDVTFYYRIVADAVVGISRPAALTGLAVFSKRAVLCGEDSRAHIFRSDSLQGLRADNCPRAVVEVLDPMVLASKVQELPQCDAEPTVQVPDAIRSQFDEDLMVGAGQRRLFVTLGQFSIIRLERDAQIVVPVLDYSIPTKECCDTPGGCPEDPCEMFSRIPFPAAEFSPQNCDGCNCPMTPGC